MDALPQKASLKPVSSTTGIWSGFKSLCRVIHNLFPFTWMTVILAALLYYVWFWEVSAHANQILYTVVLWILFACALLFGFTLIGLAAVYGMTRHKNASVVLETENEVGGHIFSDYKVYAPFFLPFVTVETEISESSLKRHATRRSIWETEWLEPVERGRLEAIHRMITVKDIFGITSVTFTMTQPVSLKIKPATTEFQMRAFQTRASGDGYSHPEGDPRGELIEMRRYQAGDPLRLVLWKVFARSRKLVVRAPEPAIVEQNDMFVYFVSGKDDEASASLARSFLATFKEGERGDLRFSADGAKRLVSDEKEGLEDVIDSVGHKNRGGEDLMSVAPLVTPSMMSHCFLMVPPNPGSWIRIVQEFVAKYQIRPVFIVSVREPVALAKRPGGKPSWLKRMLVDTEKTEESSPQIGQICEQLKSMGTIRIVDVSTGTSQDWEGAA